MSEQPQRVPNLLHTLLLFGLTFFSFLACEAVALLLSHPHPITQAFYDERLQLLASAAAYLLTVVLAWFAFPVLWNRSFLAGIRWNAAAATPWLVLAGLVLGFVAQAAESRLTIPKDLPIEQYFQNSHAIWFLVFFGTVVAPVFEEISFRGFMLPAIAILVDWLRLPRPQLPAEAVEHLDRFANTETFSTLALVSSSLVTSILFALIHAPQLGYTWPAVALLATISLALCLVRIRFNSVAASSLVHASYNFSVFLTLFVATSGFRHLERL